jgi:hypothetical protein
MSKSLKHPVIAMPTTAEDKAITSAANADPNAQPLTAKQLKAMVPLRTLRGRPKSESPMDGVLREYVTRQSRRAQR